MPTQRVVTVPSPVTNTTAAVVELDFWVSSVASLTVDCDIYLPFNLDGCSTLGRAANLAATSSTILCGVILAEIKPEDILKAKLEQKAFSFSNR